MKKKQIVFGMALISCAGTLSACELVEADWLFQCNNTVTVQAVSKEITYAREMMQRSEAATDWTKERAKLSEFEASLQQPETKATLEPVYLEVHRLKREVLFKNPLLNFDRVLLIDNPYPLGKPGDVTALCGPLRLLPRE